MNKKIKKSRAASKVLHLMDVGASYSESLKAVLGGDRRLNRTKLEKELNRYI